MTTKLTFLFAVPLLALACSSSDNGGGSSSTSASSTSSSSGSTTHSCADLAACCAKITKPADKGTKDTCDMTYAQFKSNDADCDVRYPAFASYCP